MLYWINLILHSIMKKYLLLGFISFIAFSLYSQTAEEYFKPLKYRNIGPFRGGRSVSSSGVVNDQLTYYMGVTGGGLWKTEDAGQRWKNVSDGFFETGSVGCCSCF